MKDELLKNGLYRSTYRPGELELQDGVTLIHSDLLVKDQPLQTLLDSVGQLDAITLWFAGVHKARSATELAKHFEVEGDADHRELVEDFTLQIGHERLRSGGWLQLVIRAGFQDAGMAQSEMGRIYGDWLQGQPFVLKTVTARPYDEPQQGQGISVKSLAAEVNQLPNFAISLLIQKV